MDRENTKKNDVEKIKSHKGKKKLDASTSKPQCTNLSRKVKAKNLPISPNSSSYDDIDEDYAEFLKTYIPEEFYAYGPLPREEEGSQITVESAARTTKSSKMEASK
ncbi:hypothetical protein QL285_045368 [Trifolium repens]|jgi:hypothetical protein|nr:hypothetical protein QL285_045368 [Trifolium repens]